MNPIQSASTSNAPSGVDVSTSIDIAELSESESREDSSLEAHTLSALRVRRKTLYSLQLVKERTAGRNLLSVYVRRRVLQLQNG